MCTIYTSEHSVNIRAYSGKFGFRNNWNIVTSRHLIHVTSRLSFRVFNPHFGTFGKYSDKFGFRITFGFGHTLLFIDWIQFEIFIIFWLRYVFIMTLVIIRYTKNFSNIMSIKIEISRITDKRVSYRPQIPTSNGNEVCVSNFTLIKCRLKLKAQEILQTCQLHRPRSPTSNSNECFCVRLRIDQTLIKIESSRNITNVSAIDPKVRPQMATSVCVFDFKLIKCRL